MATKKDELFEKISDATKKIGQAEDSGCPERVREAINERDKAIAEYRRCK